MPKLDTNYGSIRALLTGDKKFVVPPYQRRFGWKPRKQLVDLWEDVARRYLDSADTRTHFLGAVVLGEGRPPDPLGVTEFVVIDGQQRLISLALLLAALRDELVDGDEQRQDITRKYLVHSTARGDFVRLRVEPGKADLETYKQCILGESVGKSQSPIAVCFRFFKKKLREGLNEEELTGRDEAEGEDSGSEDSEVAESGSEVMEGAEPEPVASEAAKFHWERLLKAILDQLEVVTISDVTSENAYEVFRTLNSLGLELSQVDLLRNAFFYLVPGPSGARIHDEIWEPMEQGLGEDLMERFFHTELLRRGNNIPRDETYRTFMRLINQDAREDRIAALLRELHGLASVYAAVRLVEDPPPALGEKKLSNEHVRLLRRLREWGSDPAYPLILECAMRWKNGGLSGNDLATVLRWIESLLVRRFIVGTPPNDLRSVFARLMKQLADELRTKFKAEEPDSRAFVALLRTLLQEPVRRWPTDDDVRKATTDQSLYRETRTKECFLVLRLLAEEIEGKECPQIVRGREADKYSVEHVLPQGALTEEWKADLKGWGELDAQQLWLERKDVLGNLTLTAYNSELAQKRFAAKKDFIKEHLYLRLSKQIAEADQWTRAEIDARTEQLTDIALKLWPGPEDPVAV